MSYVERGVVSDEQTDLLSVSGGQHRVPPVCLFLPHSSEGTKNGPMEGELSATPAGHSTEASSPGVSPFIQKQVESPSVDLLENGAGGKRQQVVEEGKVCESNVEEWNNCSASPGKKEKEQPLARKDFWLAVAVFVLIGLNSLMAWNVMLNLAPYMAASYFDGRNYGNTFLACFQGTCVSVQIALIYFKCKPKTFLFYAGAAINIVAFLAVTPAASSCEQRIAAITVHLICLLWGAASGLLQGAGYAYSGALSVNFAVFLSAGQGMAGLAAFALNTFLGFVFFDLNTHSGLTNQAWILYSVCAVFSAILVVCIFFLASRPWARQPLRDVAKQQKDKAGKNSSCVIVHVESGRCGSKLVGQKVLPNEMDTERAGRALYRDTTDMHDAAEGQEKSAEVWTDLLDPECSKDTMATTVVASNCELLEDHKVSMLAEQTPSSHPLPSQEYVGNTGSAQSGKVTERTPAKDYRENCQSVLVVKADIGEQLKDNTCDGAQAPKRTVLVVARQVWRPLLAILTTFFITLNLFPRIGPVGWHYTQNVPNHFVILFGLFSIADTLGRSTPSLQMVNPHWLGWTIIPERVYLFATFTRMVFYIPFFLSYKLENCVVLNDFWWLSCLMLLFAFTHGWFTSMGFIHAVGKVPDSDKGTAGPLSVVALSLGVLLGLYIALAY